MHILRCKRVLDTFDRRRITLLYFGTKQRPVFRKKSGFFQVGSLSGLNIKVLCNSPTKLFSFATLLSG